MLEMRQVDITHVTQLNAFELMRYALLWVQLWDICRKALQVKSLRRAMMWELLDVETVMHRDANQFSNDTMTTKDGQSYQRAHIGRHPFLGIRHRYQSWRCLQRMRWPKGENLRCRPKLGLDCL
jgi:hypothetical protein